jgi:site-specific recombinase
MVHLDTLLNQNTAEKDYSEQVQWLLQISEWLRLPKNVESHPIPRDRIYAARIKYLLHIFSRNPQWAENFQKTVSSLLLKMSSVHLFTGVGMSAHASFLQDFMDRVQEKLLPQSPLTENLATLLFKIFPTEEESILVDGIEEPVLVDFLNLFSGDETLAASMRSDLLSSVYVLSSQLLAGALSIQNSIFDRMTSPVHWPESSLQQQIFQLQSSSDANIPQEIYETLERCEQGRLKIYERIESKGVKVDFVYLLETQRRRIDRMKSLLHLLDPRKEKAIKIRLFVSQLILDIHHQRSLRSFFSENLSLLTQRIVQRNSDVGEHYVTFNWQHFREMFRSALGGGALTSFTVFMKFFISHLKLEGFVKGLIDSLNYSSSFLAIQFMGFTLATKQPSATAPFLAQSLKRSIGESRKAVVALLRTQFVAVLGNLSSVFPICLLVSWLATLTDHPVMDSEHALATFHSTDILGPAPLYALFTGFLLFFSSLIAGWFENWVVLNRLPERIYHNQNFLSWFGRKRSTAIAETIRTKANAIAANTSLGLLLGFSPPVLKFLGFPLEVRHVTLSTGSFATSLPLVWNSGVEAWDIFNAVTGILAIGLINISVSFTLALLLASVSSQVRFSILWSLLKWGFVLVLTRPWLLVIPEKE